MPKYRIAHIITRLCVGGAQENTFHTVRLADRSRFDADLISGPTEGGEGSIEPAVLAAGIDLIREPHLVRAPAPHRDWLALRGLARTLRAGRYDLVHTHTSKAGFLGRIAAARAGIPHVVHTSHGNVFDGYFNRPLAAIFTGLERYAARHTSRFIELTPGGVEAHLERGIGRREQFCVVFSGIDPAPFEEALERRAETRTSLGISGGEVLVGGVGRLAPVKGFSYFVEMARALAPELPGVRFVLAGDGEESARLQARAGGAVRFLGMRRDIPAIMAALDMLVVPSLNEGMGRVILEAGAAGVPVVASRTGGIPDIVDDGVTGVLVAPRSAGELATAVRGLVHSPERRQGMGAAARARTLPHYSLAAMVQRIEAIYEELLHAHPPDSRR